jgi:phospholipid-transporting ATPase
LLKYIKISSVFNIFGNSEVNLKIKQALPETARHTSPQQISQLGGVLKSEQPNNRLYNYDGTLSIPSKDLGGKSKDYPVDPQQILLRGAQLRNTPWVYGIVVFTGHETKLMLNSRYTFIR